MLIAELPPTHAIFQIEAIEAVLTEHIKKTAGLDTTKILAFFNKTDALFDDIHKLTHFTSYLSQDSTLQTHLLNLLSKMSSIDTLIHNSDKWKHHLEHLRTNLDTSPLNSQICNAIQFFTSENQLFSFFHHFPHILRKTSGKHSHFIPYYPQRNIPTVS